MRFLFYNRGDTEGESMRINIDKDWKFSHLGKDDVITVDLPYDAMLREPRDISNLGGDRVGYFAGGDYLYEKELEIPEGDRAYYLDFEGIYKDPVIKIDGKEIFKANYGYSEYVIDATSSLTPGKHTLSVEAYNSDQPNSRWYSGAGLYRSVSLLSYPKEHVLPKSFKIKTLDYKEGKVSVRANLTSVFPLTLKVFDKENNEIYTETKEEKNPEFVFSLSNPHLWSIEDPYLYRFELSYGEETESKKFGLRVIELDKEKGFLLNGVRTPLLGACIHSDNGLLGAESYPDVERRKVEILKQAGYNAVRSAHNPIVESFLDAADELGLLVMDEYVDCWYIHKTKYDYSAHTVDNYPEDLKRMVDKDYSHPSVILYSIGNEVGETSQPKGIELTGKMRDVLHKLDDTRPVTCGINVWFNGISHTPFGIYSDENAEKQVKQTEKEAQKAKKQEQEGKPKKNKPEGSSDFFNYFGDKFGSSFMKKGAKLHIVDKYTKGAFANLDVAGYNYGILRYKHDLKKYPERFILGTETFCSDAGLFYELYQENPRVIGDFVWSGFDYLGEAGFNSWANSYDFDYENDKSGWLLDGGGRIDINGETTSEMDFTRVSFHQELIKIGVVSPHDYAYKHHHSAWKFSRAFESYTFPGCENMMTEIEVYTYAPYAELYLNGKKIGSYKNKKAENRLVVKTKYIPGKLTAIAYDENHKEIGKTSLSTGSDKMILHAESEKEIYKLGELIFVPFKVTDENGVLQIGAKEDVKIDKVENAELLRFGSAARWNKESYLQDHCNLYYGKAMAILRPTEKGFIHLHATSKYGDVDVTVKVI